MLNFKDFHWHMNSAVNLAHKAYHKDEVPIGCVVIDQGGSVIAEAHNLKESNHDPTGHAEIIALREAAAKIESWRLTNCTLIVTLEPCPMCLSAMVQARIKRCVFGTYDPKGGAISLGYRLFHDQRLNHQFSVMGGVKHWECSQILSQYFREKRQRYKDRLVNK